MSKPSLIITGASGLVGSRFVELYSNEFTIHNLDLATGVDITDLRAVEQFISTHPATSLVHLAAFTDTARAETESGDENGLCYQVNVVGTRNLANACARHQLHLIHVSTDFVFDGNKDTPYIETDSPNALGWYGKTKALAEEEVANLVPSVAIARLSYPYRSNYPLKPDIISKLRSGLKGRTLPPQFNDTLITPTFVDDIALGFYRLIKHHHTGIFHLVGSSYLSPYDLALTVAQAFNLDPSQVRSSTLSEYLKHNPRPYAKNGAISNAATQAKLGLTFSTLTQGLALLKAQQAL